MQTYITSSMNKKALRLSDLHATYYIWSQSGFLLIISSILFIADTSFFTESGTLVGGILVLSTLSSVFKLNSQVELSEIKGGRTVNFDVDIILNIFRAVLLLKLLLSVLQY